ncbi:hypothetical protein D3C85_1213410 [compost metagenome]
MKDKLARDLSFCLSANSESLENLLEVYHRANALQQACIGKIESAQRALLIEASRKIVLFVLSSCELITSFSLWSTPAFKESNPRKIGSNLEARSEMLCKSIERLIFLESYDQELKGKVESGGSEIKACLLMKEALNEWIANRWSNARALLGQAHQLATSEPELDELYRSWQSMEKHHSEADAKRLKLHFLNSPVE